MSQPTFDAAVAWLRMRAVEAIRAARRKMTDGTSAFPPQVATHYEAFWLRDYAYMLAGCPEAFSDDELRTSCRLFVGAQRADGAMVDCVRFDGSPVYRPGYDTMGSHPVADGSQFTVDVAWATWRRLHDEALVAEVLPALERGLAAVPRAGSGLVWIDPSVAWDRCPYGFTDTVRKTGAELFSSLLIVQACRQLAELQDAVGHRDAAAGSRTDGARTAAALRSTLWSEADGLFLAASRRCRQPDLWGSAFAIHLGVANDDQTLRIATYLQRHHDEVVLAGQVRHLPAGTHWEHALSAPGTYQNGGFWGTPSGWVAGALRHVDPTLAEKMIIDLVVDYRAHGAYEWIIMTDDGWRRAVPDYLASLALPLQVLTRW